MMTTFIMGYSCGILTSIALMVVVVYFRVFPWVPR